MKFRMTEGLLLAVLVIAIVHMRPEHVELLKTILQ